jgi:hypothetical protein
MAKSPLASAQATTRIGDTLLLELCATASTGAGEQARCAQAEQGNAPEQHRQAGAATRERQRPTARPGGRDAAK